MEVVSQKVSTSVSTVPVKDSEERAFWPVLHILLAWGLHDVEDYTNSVFIIVSNDSLICVGCISDDASILSYTTLGWFPGW